LDLVILFPFPRRRRAFSGPRTFLTEQEAIRGCHTFGRRIIDGVEPGYSLEDLR
jgi:hypothetical protein